MDQFSKDILFFGKTIRPKIFEVQSPEFHKEIAAHLRRPEYQFMNIIAPRGFAKSTLVAFMYVLWHMFVEDYANKRKQQPKVVVLVSKSRPHSINLLSTIKNALEHSPNFKRIFGYWGEHSSRIWREDMIVLKNGTTIVCRGMGTQIRGINVDSMRPTLVVLDDAEDEENTKTDMAIDRNRRWFLQALVPMIKRTHPRGRIVNIGTPQHQSCLVYTLKNMPKMWKTLHYSAIIEEEGQKPKSIWPEMMTLKDLNTLKSEMEKIGKSSSFYREYMCQVVGDNDSLVNSDQLRFWDGSAHRSPGGRWAINVTHRGITGDEKLEKSESVPVFVFMGVDPASTLSTRSDFSVIFIIGVDSDKNIYCLDYFRKRVKPMQLTHAIIEKFETWQPERTRIESVGYQDMIRDYLRTEYQEYIPGLEIKHSPRSSKSHRLESLQPMFARNKVFLKKNMHEFWDELLLYPRASHDDTLDGFYYAQLKSYGPTEGTSYVERQHMDNELKHYDFYHEEENSSPDDWLLA
jgi:predicted phage terminase large subunit-like protein